MVTYDFYTEEYRGSSITKEEWPTYEAQADAQLRRYKRVYAVIAPEENAEAMAVCAMADACAYFVAAQNGAGAVTSASIGSVSVSYGSSNGSTKGVDISTQAQDRELLRCAKQYLNIYRGVGGC